MTAFLRSESDTLESLHLECFACGAGNQRGLNLHFDVDREGVATATWRPSAEFRSYPDRVHGGVAATLMDSAMVHALFARGVAGVTAELNLRYLRSMNLERPVLITGGMESCRHRVYSCRAEVRQGGTLVVRASAKFMAMPDSRA